MRIPVIVLTAVLATGVHARQLSPQQTTSVTDSAGVRIVESSAPAWSAGAGWRVGAEPILTIGEVSGDLDYLFEQGPMRFASKMEPSSWPTTACYRPWIIPAWHRGR